MTPQAPSITPPAQHTFYFRPDGLSSKAFRYKDQYIGLAFSPAELNDEQRAYWQANKDHDGDLLLVGWELWQGVTIKKIHPAPVGKTDGTPLSVADLFTLAIDLERELADLKQQAEAIQQARQLAQQQAQAERAQELAQRQAQQAAAQAQAVREAATIEWSADNTAITNLHERVLVVSGLEVDSRWKQWVYEVTGINTQTVKRDMPSLYTGAYLETGTVLTPNIQRVFIVASEAGSNKHRRTHYALVSLSGGKLVKHDWQDTNAEAGWALRALPHVKAALDYSQPQEKPVAFTPMELQVIAGGLQVAREQAPANTQEQIDAILVKIQTIFDK